MVTLIPLLASMWQHLLYRSLGLCVAMADPPEDQRLNLLNEVWKVVTKLKNPAVGFVFLLCLRTFDMSYEFVLQIFSDCNSHVVRELFIFE